MSGNTSAVPSPACACPLCGGPNACAPAASGHFTAPCWCEAVTFGRSLLERVPEPLRGTACICATCARVESTLAKVVAPT